MKKRLLTAGLILFSLTGAYGQSPMIGQYTADQTMTALGKTIQGKIFVDNGKIRIDMSLAGTHVSSIIRPDKNMVYLVMAAQKLVMEVPVEIENQMLASANSKDAKRRKVGTETIRGQSCDKYQITSGDTVVYLWAKQASNIPVQMQSADERVKVEWSNVKPGPQPANLFEIPTDYRRISRGGK